MKKIINFVFAVTLFVNAFSYAQTALKKGSVTYKMVMTGNDDAAAMMGESTIQIHFDAKNQATDMSMMGGMILMKTITPVENVKETKMAFDAMGMKYEITDAGEQASQSNKSMGNLENAVDVSYDKNDTKEIVGFKCYKAKVKMNDGTTSDFYITDAIAPQQTTNDVKIKLSGYPLEIIITTDQGNMTMTATSFSKELPKDCFVIGEGYKKVTMDEFQKQMGGM
mgnify:CR=1 FL=1